MYLQNRLYDAAKLHHHQSLLVAQPEEAPQDSSWHEDIWSILKQIHFTKLHKVYQSVCCQPKITIIETQRKRRESCMSLDLDSHFINSHGLWWTLMDSQKISTLPRHGHAAVEAVRYSHLGSRISRQRKETEQENAGNNICRAKQPSKSLHTGRCDLLWHLKTHARLHVISCILIHVMWPM